MSVVTRHFTFSQSSQPCTYQAWWGVSDSKRTASTLNFTSSLPLDSLQRKSQRSPRLLMINREGEGGHYAVKSLQGVTSPVLPPMRRALYQSIFYSLLCHRKLLCTMQPWMVITVLWSTSSSRKQLSTARISPKYVHAQYHSLPSVFFVVVVLYFVCLFISLFY